MPLCPAFQCWDSGRDWGILIAYYSASLGKSASPRLTERACVNTKMRAIKKTSDMVL